MEEMKTDIASVNKELSSAKSEILVIGGKVKNIVRNVDNLKTEVLFLETAIFTFMGALVVVTAGGLLFLVYTK